MGRGGVELGLDDDDEPDTSHLEVFLATQSMNEFIPIFKREKIDLDALLLCSDNDLKSIHIPLGPRKKIIDTCQRRLETIEDPGCIEDTELWRFTLNPFWGKNTICWLYMF